MKFYLIFQQSYIRVTHSSMQVYSWLVDISVGYGSNSQWLRFPVSKSCERFVRPQGSFENLLEEDVIICYEVNFTPQIIT